MSFYQKLLVGCCHDPFTSASPCDLLLLSLRQRGLPNVGRLVGFLRRPW